MNVIMISPAYPARHVHIDLVECLWEPYMLLAARLREELGLPGLTMRQTMPFRDKELMKAVLDEAGLRTPGHHSTDTVAGVWAAAERLGYPLIVKPDRKSTRLNSSHVRI